MMLTIKLSKEQAIYVVNLLKARPYQEVASLVEDILAQTGPQVEQMNREQKDASD